MRLLSAIILSYLFLINYPQSRYYLIHDLYHSADECAAGTYRGADMSSCVSCDENSVSTAGASSCTACDAGTVAYDDSTDCGKLINHDEILIPIIIYLSNLFLIN